MNEDLFFSIFSPLTGFGPTIFVSLFIFGIGKRFRKHGYLAFGLGVLALLPFPLAYRLLTDEEFWVCRYLLIGGWYYATYILYWLLATLLFFLSFKVGIKEALFYASAAYALESFISGFTSMYRFFAFDSKVTIPYLLSTLPIKAVIIVGYYFLIVRRFRRRNGKVDNAFLLIFLLVSLLLINVLSQLVFDFVSVEKANNYVDAKSRLYSMFCSFLLLAVQFGFFERNRLDDEKKITERVMEETRKHQTQSQENVELINRKCHDIRKQLRALNVIADDEQRKRSIGEITEAMRFYELSAKTGSQVLDALLTEKMIVCERKGITLSYMLDGKALEFIEGVDLYTLFANIIDNAIRAVEEEGVEREIMIKTIQKDSLLEITEENHLKGSLTFHNGLPLTTKEDADFHGYGTKSIKYVAEKYGGNLLMKQEGDRFLLKILFLR